MCGDKPAVPIDVTMGKRRDSNISTAPALTREPPYKLAKLLTFNSLDINST